jgi:uncharacterized protein YhaN
VVANEHKEINQDVKEVDIQALIEQAAASASKAKVEESDKAVVDDNVDADRSLEQMIEKQAKEIEMQQLKQAKKDEKNGKMKISPAALALNSAEMGLEVKADDKESGNTILGISSDQIYTTTATDK